ncbi:MAG: hypothetical protein JJU00_08760 [Opitutales bacterium]|nr:hypothetical protein [Opitutales bacterium]
MQIVLVYILFALLMVVPVFLGVRLLFVDPDHIQEWSGFRFSLPLCRRLRRVAQLLGVVLIAAGIYFGVKYVF